jgi:hypothetical protein
VSQVGREDMRKVLNFEQFLDEESMLTPEGNGLGPVAFCNSLLAAEKRNELVRFNDVQSAFVGIVFFFLLLADLWPREYLPLLCLSWQWIESRRHLTKREVRQ